jgi:hypothetical protein
LFQNQQEPGADAMPLLLWLLLLTCMSVCTACSKTTVSVSTAVDSVPDNGLCPGVMYNVKVGHLKGVGTVPGMGAG